MNRSGDGCRNMNEARRIGPLGCVRSSGLDMGGGTVRRTGVRIDAALCHSPRREGYASWRPVAGAITAPPRLRRVEWTEVLPLPDGARGTVLEERVGDFVEVLGACPSNSGNFWRGRRESDSARI